MLPQLEEGRYIFFSDEEGITQKVDLYEPVNQNIVLLANESKFYINYLLYSSSNPYQPNTIKYQELDSLQDSNFDPAKVTVFIIHGWLNDRASKVNTDLTEAFLQDADVNIIVVDWSYIGKNICYPCVVASVPRVGKNVGKCIKWLATAGGLSLDKVHVVGFSLGAHVAGNAGREAGSQIRRITALDPAAPFFHLSSPDHIVKTDAQYVEVIHTNTQLFGVRYPCGHADFFPNGGYCMPGCILNLCSHSKSYVYMAQSILLNNMFAQQCQNMEEVDEDNCQGDSYQMGNSDLSKNGTGLFRLKTLNMISLDINPKDRFHLCI